MFVMQVDEPNENEETVNDNDEKTSEQVKDEYKRDGDETESNPDPGSPPSYDL